MPQNCDSAHEKQKKVERATTQYVILIAHKNDILSV